MKDMKNNKYYLKWIAGTTAGLLIILSGLMLAVQEHKINKLEDELYIKKQNEQRATDFYESTINIKTIQSKFNTLQEYSIMKDCMVSMNHTYYYTNDSILGLKKQVRISGRGQLQYNANVNLSSAILTTSNNGKTITIEIEKPYIDEESIHLKSNSLIIDESNANWVSNKYDSMEAQRLFTDSFNVSGKNNILDLYKTEEKQNYLNKIAIAEVQSLIRTLNINGNTNIIVKVAK